MEHISKNNSLETAKNRLDISGLTYVEGTKYVYDKILGKETSDVFVKYIPLIETSDGYVLRYKNLMRQFYWLINEFIPSCSYEKLCIRNGEKTWIEYDNACEALKKYFTFSFYDNDNLIASISVASGNTATQFTPSKAGFVFNGWTTENGGEVFFDFSTPITENTSVYAKYEIKQVTLTFILNNGQDPVEIMFIYGTSSDDISQELRNMGILTPEKEGYYFIDWYPEITTATKDCTYEATYGQGIYIIRFFDIIDSEHILDYYDEQPIDGGDASEYRIVKTETLALHDQSIYYTTRPTYQHFECIEEDGYTWWVNREGEPISASTFLDVTNDLLDVFPKLTKKKYEVSFLDWDDSIIETGQTVEYLSGATAPADPSREHYTFTGWDTQYSSITDNTIVHATYVGDDINVTYMLPDIGGGSFSVYSSITTTFNSTAPTVDPPTSEIYPPEDYGVFDGWYTDSTYTEPFDYTTILEGDTVIYGKWKTEFEVTFYNWDGTLITGDTQTGFANPIYVGYGEDVPDAALDLIIQNMLDKHGYEFLGWNKSTTGITYDVRITAVFDDTQMCIVRFINSIDETVISSTTVVFGTTILLSEYPAAPTVEHMTFTGWDGNTTQVFSDMDVYAMYRYSDITVHFYDYDNYEVGTEIVQYGQTAETPDFIVSDTSARGYNGNEEYIVSTLRFNGTYCLIRDEFDTETGCSIPEETIITEDNNRFTAQYDEIATAITTCNVRFYNYDTAYWFTDTVLYGTVIDSAYTQNILDMFVSEGHSPDLNVQTFYAWSDEYEYEYIIGVNDLVVTRDIKLYAKYKMITYSVKFYVQSNPDYYPEIIDMPISSLETEAIKNTAINRPDCSDIPERIHFETFCDGTNNRWYTDPDCTIEWQFKQDVQMQPVANPNLVTEDIILYGKYIGKEYTLTYNTNGGSSITQEAYRYPMPTVRPSNPTKQDTTFVGWYTDDETFENEFVFGEPLTDNTTIYAKWFDEPEENTIQYTANADLRTYMPDMGNAHLIQERCVWDITTREGILVYDAPVETFNIGTLNRSNNVTVNTEIKRNLRIITIPSQVVNVVTGQFEDCRYLYAIYVSEGNSYYNSKNGILYSISRRIHTINIRLECYPQAKVDEDFILNDLEVGYSYVMINELCFANCKKLKTIHLNENVLAIESKAFLNCINLEEITCDRGPLCPDAEVDTFEGVDTENCKLYVKCQSYNSYAEHAVWGQFDIQCNGTVLYLTDDIEILIEDNILTKQSVDDALNQVSAYSANRSDIIGIKIGSNVTKIDHGNVFSNTGVFQGCDNLSSVTFGNNITEIGEAAFARDGGLVNIVIPDSVVVIYTSTFYSCTGLTSIEIGSGLTSILDAAFLNCSSLNSLYIPYTVQGIGESVFANCTSLQSITCDRITPPYLGNIAFDNTNNCPIYVPCQSVATYKSATNWRTYEHRIQCPPQTGTTLYLSDSSTVVISDNILTASLIRDQYSGTVVACEIGENVTELGPAVFENCSLLTSVTIPDSVTSIGYSAFEDCSSLTSVTIPDSVTDIYYAAFRYCTSLVSINIPSGVTSLSMNIFQHCHSLTSVTIPDSVTDMEDQVFESCPSLTSINIPDSVTSIGNSAFKNCSGLTSITCERITPPTIGFSVFDNTNNCPIYVPCESVNTYKTATNWSTYQNRIYCKENVTILRLNNGSPDVIITNNTLTESLISDQYSDTLVACEIGRNVTSINKAFRMCYGLTSVTIHDGITSIGNESFNACYGLKSVTIPNSVTSIGTYAFQSCTSLTSITIPDGVTSIGNSAFDNSGLKSVTIPNSVTSIGNSAFYTSTSLISVTIGDRVTRIGNNSFYGCSQLRSVTIGSGVTNINYAAFKNCYYLASVTCNATTPPTLASEVFTNAAYNFQIYVPCESLEIYKTASGWSSYATKITCRNS